ncbi:hypothetical protein DOE63_08405 [Salmonella enterica subsp. diarizonae serovar 59:z10:-]|nr:hypothetical protein DOE63_08405 [Salmonella enterica subsp. diarizonae serovar 59:z10:-]EHR8187322.1 hypothetical protein [Salmonella enterica]
MILINSTQLGEPPALDLSFLGGLFGGLPAGPMEECRNANTALIIWSKITPGTLNHPNAGVGYGILQTLDTLGVGPTGKRYVPANTVMQEWVFQNALMIDGTLMGREKINQMPWTPWTRRW